MNHLQRHELNTRRSYEPTMEQLQHRLATDMELLKRHPENKELLEQRIARHKKHILAKALGLPLE